MHGQLDTRTLGDWAATLDAYERNDRAWLAERLDAFTKWELFSAALAESGRSWKDLRTNQQVSAVDTKFIWGRPLYTGDKACFR